MQVNLGVLIGSIGTLIGIIGTVLAWHNNSKKELEKNTERLTEMKTLLSVIDKNTDETKTELKEVNSKMSVMSERLIIVEKSTEKAHQRIDKLEKMEKKKR